MRGENSGENFPSFSTSQIFQNIIRNDVLQLEMW